MRLNTLFTLLLCCLLRAQAQDELLMLVGTYTDGGSRGIYSYRFNQSTGQSAPLDSLALRNPSYLTISRNGRLVYAVSETRDEQASLNIISFGADGAMRLLDSAPTGGADPCYVDVRGGIALTANYTGGSMTVFNLRDGGGKAIPSTSFFGATGGPDSTRQEVPHIHCATFTPDGQYVLATDFSADRILSFRHFAQKITAHGEAADVSADSGPRHLVFSPDGRYAYLMSELSGSVTVFSYSLGRLTALQEIVSDTTRARGGADIHLSPDGRFLYASNRLGADGIAIFAVDSATGLLTRAGYQPTALHPRQFNITPNGQYLVCCCRDSGVLQVFRRDKATGLLTDTHLDIHLSKPVCVQFH